MNKLEKIGYVISLIGKLLTSLGTVIICTILLIPFIIIIWAIL